MNQEQQICTDLNHVIAVNKIELILSVYKKRYSYIWLRFARIHYYLSGKYLLCLTLTLHMYFIMIKADLSLAASYPAPVFKIARYEYF